MKNLKVIGVLVTIAGAGLTLLQNWLDDKKLDERIDERIEEKYGRLGRSDN